MDGALTGVADNTLANPIYSANQVSITTFFFGPIAGCWMIANNSEVLGSARLAQKFRIGSLFGTLLLGVIAFFLPEDFPSIVLITAYSMSLYYYAKSV